MDIELISVPELARMWGLQPRTIYNLVSQRKLPAVKVGGSVKFRRQDLDEYLEKQRMDKPKRKKTKKNRRG